MLPEKYIFPDEHLSARNRFSFGDRSPNLSQMLDSRPVFAFDFLCCADQEFSFFNLNVTTFDLQKTLKRFNELSKITIGVLLENEERLHFHNVTNDVRCNSKLAEDLATIFGISLADVLHVPTLFQIEVHTDNKKDYGSRIIGFFGQGCEFHVIWFDRLHKLYNRKRK